VKTKTETFPLEEANVTIEKFRSGGTSATPVLVIDAAAS